MRSIFYGKRASISLALIFWMVQTLTNPGLLTKGLVFALHSRVWDYKKHTFLLDETYYVILQAKLNFSCWKQDQLIQGHDPLRDLKVRCKPSLLHLVELHGIHIWAKNGEFCIWRFLSSMKNLHLGSLISWKKRAFSIAEYWWFVHNP